MDVKNLFEFNYNTGTIVYYKGNANDVIVVPNKINGVTVKHIGAYAFCKSRKICVIKLPQTIETIGEGAFYECTALVSINIPYRVTKLAKKLFYLDKNLEYINIEGDIIERAEDAFIGCVNLKI